MVQIVVEERPGLVTSQHLVCLGDDSVHLRRVLGFALVRVLRQRDLAVGLWDWIRGEMNMMA